ncbi:MAG: chitin disaccharide deacetylase [Coprobacillaceae bacterium]
MIKRLIVNADDFGIAEGASIGIIHSHTDGILTSTTCMMNMPFAKFALNLAKDYPKLGVGIHLVLTVGRPLVDGAKSYTDENGNFTRPSAYPNKHPENIDLDELYKEWKAQLELFIETAGKKPTHIDSHHHVHLLPELQEVSIRLAKEYDLPMRQTKQITDHYEYIRCADQMYDDKITYDFLVSELSVDDEGVEYMCHPAYIDQRLYDMTSYCLPRMKELELLRSTKIKNFIKDNGIELINYTDLKKK